MACLHNGTFLLNLLLFLLLLILSGWIGLQSGECISDFESDTIVVNYVSFENSLVVKKLNQLPHISPRHVLVSECHFDAICHY